MKLVSAKIEVKLKWNLGQKICNEDKELSKTNMRELVPYFTTDMLIIYLLDLLCVWVINLDY